MAQENLELGRQHYEAGVMFYVLYDPYAKGDVSNDKALKYAFERFKIAASLGNFDAKVIAACLAKSFGESYPTLTQDELNEIAHRGNVINNCAYEDLRNYALCLKHRFLEFNDKGLTNDDVAFLKFKRASKNSYRPTNKADDLAEYFYQLECVGDNSKLSSIKLYAGETLTHLKHVLKHSTHLEENEKTQIQSEIKRLEQERNKLIEMEETKSPEANEVMLCASNSPTEVVGIIQDFMHKISPPRLVAASISNLFSVATPAPVPTTQPQQEDKRQNCIVS